MPSLSLTQLYANVDQRVKSKISRKFVRKIFFGTYKKKRRNPQRLRDPLNRRQTRTLSLILQDRDMRTTRPHRFGQLHLSYPTVLSDPSQVGAELFPKIGIWLFISHVGIIPSVLNSGHWQSTRILQKGTVMKCRKNHDSENRKCRRPWMSDVKWQTRRKNRQATRQHLHHERYELIPQGQLAEREDPWAWH